MQFCGRHFIDLGSKLYYLDYLPNDSSIVEMLKQLILVLLEKKSSNSSKDSLHLTIII